MEGGHSGRRQRNTVFILVLKVFVEGSSGKGREGAREGGKGEGVIKKRWRRTCMQLQTSGKSIDTSFPTVIAAITWNKSFLAPAAYSTLYRAGKRRGGWGTLGTRPLGTLALDRQNSQDALHRVRGSAEHCGGNFRSPTPEGRI